MLGNIILAVVTKFVKHHIFSVAFVNLNTSLDFLCHLWFYFHDLWNCNNTIASKPLYRWGLNHGEWVVIFQASMLTTGPAGYSKIYSSLALGLNPTCTMVYVTFIIFTFFWVIASVSFCYIVPPRVLSVCSNTRRDLTL